MISWNLYGIMNFIYIFIIALTSHQSHFKCISDKNVRIISFSKNNQNISITFVMTFFITPFENIYISKKKRP